MLILLIFIAVALFIWALVLLYRVLDKLQEQGALLAKLLNRPDPASAEPPPAAVAPKAVTAFHAPSTPAAQPPPDWNAFYEAKQRAKAARKPSAFQQRTTQLFRRMVNWLLLNEEYRPQGVSLEFAIASTWLLRLAVIIFVIGIGFFLKYSIDQGFISPLTRVLLAFATGIGLILSGARMLNKTYHLLAQGLLGGGIAVLYSATYAAYSFYHLLPAPLAFLAMAAITGFTGFAALHFNSLLTAILGLIGGYGTPMLFPNLDTSILPFLAYLLALGIGVSWIAQKRNWPLLITPAILATYLLTHFHPSFIDPVPAQPGVMVFLCLFFLIFNTAILLPALAQKRPTNAFDIGGLLLNTFGFAQLSTDWLGARFDQFAAAGLCVYYFALVLWLAPRRQWKNTRMTLAEGLFPLSSLLAIFFLAWTFILSIQHAYIPLLWALQGTLLFMLGQRLPYKPIQYAAIVLCFIVLAWNGITLLKQLGCIATAPFLETAPYFPILARHFFQTGLPLLLIGGTAVYAHAKGWKTCATAGLGATYALFWAFLSLETWIVTSIHFPKMQMAGLSLLWAVYALITLLAGLRYASQIFRYTALALFGLVVWKVFFLDLRALDLVVRIIAFLLLGGLFFLGSLLYLRAAKPNPENMDQ